VSWIINWNGVDYDVDPSEFTGGELKLVKERTGLRYSELVQNILAFDGEAICAIFWVAARRTNPELKFSEFDGPPLRLVMANLEGLNAAMDDLGKAMGMPDEENPETNGSDSSPSTPAGTETSRTD
jgi:hypothetical protein